VHILASEFTFIQRAKDTCRAFGAEVSPDTFVALLTAFGFVQQAAWRIFGVSPKFREVLGGKCVVVAMGTFRTLSTMTKIIERARAGMEFAKGLCYSKRRRPGIRGR